MLAPHSLPSHAQDTAIPVHAAFDIARDKAIRTLIAKLDSDNFYEREDGSSKLKERIIADVRMTKKPLAWKHLIDPATAKSPEDRRRREALMEVMEAEEVEILWEPVNVTCLPDRTPQTSAKDFLTPLRRSIGDRIDIPTNGQHLWRAGIDPTFRYERTQECGALLQSLMADGRHVHVRESDAGTLTLDLVHWQPCYSADGAVLAQCWQGSIPRIRALPRRCIKVEFTALSPGMMLSSMHVLAAEARVLGGRGGVPVMLMSPPDDSATYVLLEIPEGPQAATLELLVQARAMRLAHHEFHDLTQQQSFVIDGFEYRLHPLEYDREAKCYCLTMDIPDCPAILGKRASCTAFEGDVALGRSLGTHNAETRQVHWRFSQRPTRVAFDIPRVAQETRKNCRFHFEGIPSYADMTP